MMFCLVTDRHRLAPGASLDVGCHRLAEQAEWAASVALDLIQVRERDLEAAALARLVDTLVRVTRGSRTRIVVNDRLDVALACGADGVHLRHDSIEVEAARRLSPPGFLVGLSIHAADEARLAGPVDYLIAGTVFPTAAKSGAPLLGLAGLADVVRAATAPVLAIGGVGADKLNEIAAAGASGVAGISLFIEWFHDRQRPA
jgi:thiamine-phosphate pyrophosphorylase